MMLTISRRAFVALAAVATLGLVRPAPAAETPIRIGWQPTTTVEAQIAHTLRKTDILERNGLKGELTMFSYGPAVNEALISGAIDVGFIGDMPSVSLTATGAPVTIVGRQSTFRGSIVASPGSGIDKIGDLKGRKLYGPFGSSIYLAAVAMLDKAGLKAGRDVEIVNMGFADLADALKAKRIEATFVWDPWVGLFEQQGLARVLASDTSLTMVIAMRNNFIEANPDAVERFLKAHKEALLYAASNAAVANRWFREPEAARTLDEALIQATTAYDPQWSAKSLKDVRVAFTPEEQARYQGLARTAYDLKITPRLSPLADRLDLTVARKVDGASWAFDPAAVKLRP